MRRSTPRELTIDDPVIEKAPSGRARCRGCGRAIAKGEPRLGERLPNPFAEERLMTLWFHLRCGAFKRPAVLRRGIESMDDGSLRSQIDSIRKELGQLPTRDRER